MTQIGPRKSAVRPNTKTCFVCLDQVEGWMVGRLAQGKSVGCGFENTACGPLSLCGHSPTYEKFGRGYGRTVRRLRSC